MVCTNGTCKIDRDRAKKWYWKYGDITVELSFSESADLDEVIGLIEKMQESGSLRPVPEKAPSLPGFLARR